MMTARTAVAVMAGTVALHLHPQHAPWSAPGTVPILDPVELRNPCSYLLCRAWRFLAPLAAVLTSAWTVWGLGPRCAASWPAGRAPHDHAAHLGRGTGRAPPGFPPGGGSRRAGAVSPLVHRCRRGARDAAVPAHHGSPRSGAGPTQGRGAVTGWSQSMAPPRDASGPGRQDASTRAAAGHGSSAYRVDQGSQRGGSGRSQPARTSNPALRDPPDGRALRSQGSQRSAVHRGQASQPALADTPQQLICCAPKWTCTPSAHGSTTPASTRRPSTHRPISRRRRKQSPPLARTYVPQSDMPWKDDAEGMAHLGTL